MAGYEIVSDALDDREAKTAVHATTPTDAERAACRAAAEACEMIFTGIDIRRRPDGSFALLECNPSAMFAAIERRTGAAPVTQALSHLLARGCRPDTSTSPRPSAGDALDFEVDGFTPAERRLVYACGAWLASSDSVLNDSEVAILLRRRSPGACRRQRTPGQHPREVALVVRRRVQVR